MGLFFLGFFRVFWVFFRGLRVFRFCFRVSCFFLFWGGGGGWVPFRTWVTTCWMPWEGSRVLTWSGLPGSRKVFLGPKG